MFAFIYSKTYVLSRFLQYCSAVSGVNCDVIKEHVTMVTYRRLTFELELKQSNTCAP